MNTEDRVKQICAEVLVKTMTIGDAYVEITNIIQQESKISYGIGYEEGTRKGEETGYQRGLQDMGNTIHERIADYPSLSYYDKERIRNIVTGNY